MKARKSWSQSFKCTELIACELNAPTNGWFSSQKVDWFMIYRLLLSFSYAVSLFSQSLSINRGNVQYPQKVGKHTCRRSRPLADKFGTTWPSVTDGWYNGIGWKMLLILSWTMCSLSKIFALWIKHEHQTWCDLRSVENIFLYQTKNIDMIQQAFQTPTTL